jgi:ADP-L-glycero-D-manno-heptose 6-epimerase
MVFASSAAVYGNGNGPLNLYAESKLQSERDISDHAVCFRLFNVYGKNESHKGRMSSVILKWWNELTRDGCIRIFEGSESFKRDFIHVQDVCRILWNGVSMSAGVYDLGTGISHSFDSLADMVLSTHESGRKIHIPMPEDLRSQYQTDTKAAASPFIEGCISLSDGVNLYCNYLKGIS